MIADVTEADYARSMGFINLAEKTINAKLVYYGCGMGGKTTSLEVVHEVMCPRNDVQLVSIKTEEDATLLFDFLPIDLGHVEGFKVRIQGFTVPGQPKYKRMRKYVLSGADAVVFVVDSETSRLEENIQSLASLRDNLRSNGLDPESIPLVVQYNKRDLDDILSEQELDRYFKLREDVATFPSVATDGAGVFEAFTHAAGMLVDAKVRLYGLGRGQIDPAAVAEGARRKLWDIHDASRATETAGDSGAVELTFDDDGQRTEGVVRQSDQASGDALFDDADFDLDLSSAPPASSEVWQPPAIEPREEPPLADGVGNQSADPFDQLEMEPASSSPDDDEPLPALFDAAFTSSLELSERYAELERYKNQLEQKNRELVQVAQNVAHDMRRPVSALHVMLKMLKSGRVGTMDEAVERVVDNGLLATQTMQRLIRDVVDSSRLDFDGIDLEFRGTELGVMVGQILAEMSYELEEAGVQVSVGALPRVVCDEWALSRVMMNLLGNAVQYRSADRPGRIRIAVEKEAERWVLRVADNGIGIPESDVGRLFQRFERGSNTGGISGTGLGLHIIREIMLGHGGSVWVESREGEGTTFFLGLPFEPVQPPHSSVSDVEDDSFAPQGLVDVDAAQDFETTGPAELPEDPQEEPQLSEPPFAQEPWPSDVGSESDSGSDAARDDGSVAFGQPRPRVFGRPDLG